MALKDAHAVIFKAALLAETDPTLVAYRDARNDTMVAQWCNLTTTTDAWVDSVSKSDLFDLTDVTKFDTLTQGKRDSWSLMLDNSPIDASRNKIRKAILDIWGATDSIPVLQGVTRKAKTAEVWIAQGNTATTNTVTALKLAFSGDITTEDVGKALN